MTSPNHHLHQDRSSDQDTPHHGEHHVHQGFALRYASDPINIPQTQALSTGRAGSPQPTFRERPVNPPITPTQPHRSRSSSFQGQPDYSPHPRVCTPGDGIFPMDPHPDEGVGGKHHMPTFGGRPAPGAFAVYDLTTGESNDAGPFARRGPVDRNGVPCGNQPKGARETKRTKDRLRRGDDDKRSGRVGDKGWQGSSSW